MTVQDVDTAFRKKTESNVKLYAIRKKIEAGTATMEDMAEYSNILCKLLGKTLGENISGIPESEREKFCEWLLRNQYEDANERLATVQRFLDEKQNIHIEPQKAKFPAERVRQAAHSLKDKTVSEEVIQRRAENAIANIANSFHDDYIQENAKFRNNAGLKTHITRSTNGKCCEWCTKIAGRYEYGKHPKDVFRKHDKCDCIVIYENGRQRTNVWTKKSWNAPEISSDALKFKPARFTPEQARQAEREKIQYRGLTKDEISGSPLPSWLLGGKKQSKDTVDSLTKSLKDGKITVEEYLSQLPKLPDNQHGIDDCYNTVNPNFGKKGVGMIYRKNCQRCVIAYEMRRRGYNVVAQPANLGKKGEHLDDLAFFRSGGWSHVFGASSTDFEFPKGTDSETVKKNLIEMVKSHGDGARGIVYVKWLKGSDGHVFVAENANGEVMFVDPQSGKKDVGHYLNQDISNPLETRILFVNDREITDLVKDCVKAGE